MEEYYSLKEERAKIEKRLEKMKMGIINELIENNTPAYSGGEYKAEIKYSHSVTPEFIEFLKQTNNRELINETSTCKAFEIMDMKYKFTEKQKKKFYVLKDSPALYVSKETKS